MMLAVARSSLAVSLLRYRRSWGLWLLLLIAPVGARLMISDEQGQGVVIAIGGHLPVLTSPVLGVWLGIVVSTLLLPIGYIYLRSNTNRRQPWQVEEVTAASRIGIMFGRFAGDAAVLLAMLAALNVAGWFLGLLLVSGSLNLWQISYALWLVAAPALIGVAAIRVLFDALPWLRRGLGDLCYVILWIASIAMPASVDGLPSSFATNMADFPGFVRPLVGPLPDNDKDLAVGGMDVLPGRVSLDVMAGLHAPGYVASRGAWIGIALALVLLAGVVYRPHKAKPRSRRQGWLARWLTPGPPPPADPIAPAARPARHALVQLVIAEMRLIGSGRIFLLLAAGSAVLGLFGDYRHLGSPAQLLLLIFALSAHCGRSEQAGLRALTRTMAQPPAARRIATLIAATAWAVVLAIPALTRDPSALLLALASGAGIGLIGVTLATFSGSGFAPRLVLLIGWYVYLST